MAVLNIFSCAEVSSDKTAEDASDKELSDLEKLPIEILYKIGYYLITHSESRCFEPQYVQQVSKFPVKRVFNERFNIPELVTEDVSENERS